MKCADVAKLFINTYYIDTSSEKFMNDEFSRFKDMFLKCDDLPATKKYKQVWQWRYKTGSGRILSSGLMTEKEAFDLKNVEEIETIEKHAGPFEVEI